MYVLICVLMLLACARYGRSDTVISCGRYSSKITLTVTLHLSAPKLLVAASSTNVNSVRKLCFLAYVAQYIRHYSFLAADNRVSVSVYTKRCMHVLT
jgi:hypothetical protein